MSEQFPIIAGILVVLDFAIRIAALFIVPRDRKPTAAMAWLLAIFLIPFVGIILFLLIGNSKLPKKRRERQEELNRIIAERAEGVDLVTDRSTWPDWFASLVRQNQELGALPAVGGNTAALIGDYTASIDAMADEIDTATRFVNVEFYIASFDATTKGFFGAMERAVQRGVRVRLLMDFIASRNVAGHDETVAELDRIGVEWSYMLPVRPFKGQYQRPDLRNHRKLLVVDGLVGYMGSQNLIDRTLQRAEEPQARTEVAGAGDPRHGPDRPGDQRGVPLRLVHRDGRAPRRGGAPARRRRPTDPSPAALDCQVVPSGPGYDDENNLRQFLTLVTSAQRKVIITSPYFVPDEAMMYAITSACKRGLDVQLFVSEIGDQGSVWHAQRSYYEPLLRAGVQIWLYPAPFILHSKHLSIDEDVAVIGSSNMDIRSFALNAEVTLLVRGRSFVEQMRAVEQGYRDAGRRLTLEEWEKEPASATFLDGVARLTSALQ